MKLCLVLICLLISNAFSAISINKVNFDRSKSKGKVVIFFDGYLSEYPELVIEKDHVNVLLPDAKVKGKISKRYKFSSNRIDTQVISKEKKGSSEIKAKLAFDPTKHRDQIALIIKDNRIELTLPRVSVKNAKSVITETKPKAITETKKVAVKKETIKKEYLNESYLNNLIDNTAPKALAAKKTEKIISKKAKIPAKDTIKTTLAGVNKLDSKKPKSSFSLLEYGGKFVAFLGVVLLLFYGVVTLMKKGFIKKGKLGFLNKTGQVEVLSQTHIAPKKSLMMIRAHNQVFLVSNTDAGIHPISEIKDVAGLFKDGEKKIAGNNFDDSLSFANSSEKIESVKLKKDISQSNLESSLASYTQVKEKVSFSDQLKTKVKGLKSLQ